MNLKKIINNKKIVITTYLASVFLLCGFVAILIINPGNIFGYRAKADSKSKIISNFNETQESQKTLSGNNIGNGSSKEVGTQTKEALSAPTETLKLYPMKEDGTSKAFTRSNLLTPAEVSQNPLTAIRGTVAANTKYGLTEFFSGSNTDEVTAQGAVYMRAEGVPMREFRNIPGYKIWPFPGFTRSGSGFIWFSVRRDNNKESSVWMTNLDYNLQIQRELKLVGYPGWSFQAQRILRLPDGSIVMPVTIVETKNIYTGPGRLRVYRSKDNGKSWTQSDFRSYPGRGIMESQPYVKKDGTVGIISRTNQGYLVESMYNPRTNFLSSAKATPFISPSAAPSVVNLPNGRVALSYVPGFPKTSGSNLPRKIIVLAVTKDDFKSLEAVHILATAKSLGGDGINSYVHQPRLELHNNKVFVYFEQVNSATNISSWRLSQIAGPESTDGSLVISSSNMVDALKELAEMGTYY